ncbi:MAG: recombination protein O N-terminal domain-containing protein, partial [Ligilactobacillus agilis]|nr:recombination protein O N-terminal domain-containing protein [Ligilactobacillus agilis]
MALHQGEEFRGIVVSRKNYRERDMLVKILTDRFGFKTFFVRGVAKRGFSMGAAILPYAYGTYLGSISD